MFTHEQVWRGIDRLASAFGYSPSGLARQAGLDPTSFNKSKRVSPDGKPRWPSTESLSKILAVTDSTISDFIALIGEDKKDIQFAPVRPIPIIGLAQAGRRGYFDEDGYPSGGGWDEINFPGKAGADIYGLKITGNSMEPIYRAGDLLVVSPGVTVRKGDRVVLKTSDGEIMAKEVVKQGSARVELRSCNPEHENLILAPSKIIWMARIMWVSQ